MNKLIVLLIALFLVTGILGFGITSSFTALYRITFLIVADILVILLLAKILFAGNRLARKTVKKKPISTT